MVQIAWFGDCEQKVLQQLTVWHFSFVLIFSSFSKYYFVSHCHYDGQVIASYHIFTLICHSHYGWVLGNFLLRMVHKSLSLSVVSSCCTITSHLATISSCKLRKKRLVKKCQTKHFPVAQMRAHLNQICLYEKIDFNGNFCWEKAHKAFLNQIDANQNASV